MIEHALASKFEQDSVKKRLYITYDGGQFTNKNIYQESLSLNESINSDTQLRFGSCEASKLSFTFRNNNNIEKLNGKEITAKMELGGDTENPFIFGTYKVATDTLSKDRRKRDVVAYDLLYDVLNANVIEWFKSLSFPITLKNFRDSFFNYFGIEQEETTLVNDSMLIFNSQQDKEELSGRDVVNSICEINGVFGHINRSNKFVYIKLGMAYEGFYPSENTFPGETLFPGAFGSDVEISRSIYKNLYYETYQSKRIDVLEIRTESGSLGASTQSGSFDSSSGATPNVYRVQNTLLTFGQTESTMQEMANNMLSVVENVSYIPAEADLKGNPCHEVGDVVAFVADDESTVQTYILSRNLSGIQSLKDTYIADGVETYDIQINKTDTTLQTLKARTIDLSRRVKEIEQTGSKLNVLSVANLPAYPQDGVIYLIQGTVVVE